MVRFTKNLLSKPYNEITDEELSAIGKHFAKYPIKPILKKVKCINCKNLVWYDALGEQLWECLKNPCDDLATQGDRLMNNRKILHWRKCINYKKESEPW